GFSDGETLAYQLVDNNADGTPDEILISTDLKANETKEITITFADENANPNFKKRTQAEISHKVGGEWKGQEYIGGTFENVAAFTASEQHSDHSYFIRYEGPGWESDKVGYRFYLDWRNAVDIFGKKTSDMVLQDVGQDGFDAYHEPAAWGMDILKVGKSLGLGAIGFWNENQAIRVEKTSGLQCDILQNGVLQSKIRTVYSDWEINDIKTTLTSDLTIQAGSRLTREDIVLSENLPNICTGIVKHEGTEVFTQKPENDNSWGYIATFGKQSLAEDNLGMVVFIKGSQFVDFQEDEYSHIVVLKPTDDKKVSYYFAATWEQETDGIKDLAAFKIYLENTVAILNN
ncbi:MAG: DUF4861 domain-containing protein, partial [Saprospiraceae bacterium]